ncbi:MAG: DUF4331 domain-containing protein [Candidatus Dormibacteraceae bacterium]
MAVLSKRARALALAVSLVSVLALPMAATPASASSHREAPLIAEDPVADNTDVYAFVSPDAQTTVTLIANFSPFQAGGAGPNYYKFGDDVTYDINVDNIGDGLKHIVFRYKFTTTTVDSTTFLYNTGPIGISGGVNSAYTNWNRPQTYTLTESTDGGVTFPTTIGTNLLTPPVAVGATSTPNYHALAANAIYSGLPGGIKSFAGQRDDPFFVDLGRIFDLLSVNPAGGTDFVAGLNVSSIAIQVPKATLHNPITATDNVIGVWATASRNTTTVLGPGTTTGSGPLVQVSRLGNPLVNEVVIPLGKKNTFNGSQPIGDTQFFPNVDTSELAGLFKALNIDPNAPVSNRHDLDTVFLTGVPGLNKPAAAGGNVPSEEIRLNMSIAPSTTNPNTVNRMGVLGGQTDGFPNGRRLADDVVDIELQAVDGILCQTGGALVGAPDAFNPTPGSTIPVCRTVPVNPAFGDGVNANDTQFLCQFPYVSDPWPGTGARPTGTAVTGC